MPANLNFILAAQDRLLEKLSVMARHRRDSHNPYRGEDLFGYLSSSSRENTQASITFFTLLLRCLRSWARMFATGPDGRTSEYARVYEVLVREGVWFGDQDDAVPSLRENDIGSVKAIAKKLQEQMGTGASRESLATTAAQLSECKRQMDQIIEARMSNPSSEEEINMLLDTSCEISQVLDQYQTLLAASKPPQPFFIEERKQAIGDIDLRIVQLQAEVSDARNQLFEKQTNAQGIKSADQIRKEARATILSLREMHETALADISHEAVEDEKLLPGLQARVNELMAHVDHAKMRHDAKLKDLEKLQNQLLGLKSANAEMRERLRIKGISVEMPADYSGFLTQRNAEPDAEQVAVRSAGIAVNIPEYRHLCYARDGLLYRNEDLEAGFELKLSGLEGKFRVTLVNKGQEILQRLELVVSNEPIDGIRIETEHLAPSDLAAHAKVFRIFSISVFRAFKSVPHLILSYEFHANPRILTLRLPIIYPLFITPLDFPLDRVLSNWEGLSEWQAVVQLPRLLPAIKSMADVAAAVCFQRNFCVLTNREFSELGKGEVMCLGQINQFLTWTRITVKPSEGHVGAQVVVRCRNLESRTCLLNTLVEFLGQN